MEDVVNEHKEWMWMWLLLASVCCKHRSPHLSCYPQCL